VDEVDPQKLMQSGIEGMLTSLDPYTVYLDKGERDDVELMTKGKYGGIGATIGIRNSKITIVDLVEGYSAQRQGLRIGDVITKIDSKKVSKDDYDNLSSMVKGEPGTEISLTIQREGEDEPLKFNLIREEVEIDNLSYYGFVPEESGNVYLKLRGFSISAGEEIKDALIELSEKKKIESIVLDLRGNPGGLLNAAVDVTEKFLSRGETIVTVAGRDSANLKEYVSKEKSVAGKSRLAVLIDKNSASASEIVAGAIQDHDRGIILGEHSFGKGLVQTVVPLSHDNSLKITTARYYTPSGRCIQKIDYSKDNNVVEEVSHLGEKEFRTDNNRKVESAGGIVPDSVVNGGFDSFILKDMLAKGVFFKFATHFFNTNEKETVNSISNDKLFNEFMEYIETEELEFRTKSEKMMNNLIAQASEENLPSNIQTEMDALLSKVKSNKMDIIKDSQKKIIVEIKKELAARSNGSKSRVEVSLGYDEQFNTALSVLNDTKVYNKLLNPSD
jgi:carboxyl-terminal processing protease